MKLNGCLALHLHHIINDLVESVVKSAKTALNKIINESVLTEEEYRTVLLQIQYLINTCPLVASK